MNKVDAARHIATHFNTSDEESYANKVFDIAADPSQLISPFGKFNVTIYSLGSGMAVAAITAVALAALALITLNPFILIGAGIAAVTLLGGAAIAIASKVIHLVKTGVFAHLRNCNYAQIKFEREMKEHGLTQKRKDFEEKMKPALEIAFGRIERETTKENGEEIKQRYRQMMNQTYQIHYGDSKEQELQERLHHYNARIDLLVNACVEAQK